MSLSNLNGNDCSSKWMGGDCEAFSPAEDAAIAKKTKAATDLGKVMSDQQSV
jgi:hypothetical protein